MDIHYKLEIKLSLDKLLKNLPSKDVQRIVDFLNILDGIKNPFILGQKIVGRDNLYRYRVGKYRILAEIKTKELIILVIDIAHRKDIYK